MQAALTFCSSSKSEQKSPACLNFKWKSTFHFATNQKVSLRSTAWFAIASFHLTFYPKFRRALFHSRLIYYNNSKFFVVTGLQIKRVGSRRFALENLASSELVSEIRQMNLAKQGWKLILFVSLDFLFRFASRQNEIHKLIPFASLGCGNQHANTVPGSSH